MKDNAALKVPGRALTPSLAKVRRQMEISMREVERLRSVKEFLFDYVKTPSLRHSRDRHSPIGD
ncbi:MAG: hypothetical protein JWM91_2235 [Rhodospirillales bacterium]|nr:hypothetical protein [Rhodospirillales bacterium]